MAKIHEEIIVVKLSKLVKDSESGTNLASEELVSSLEAVAQELADAGIVVEVEKA